MGSRLLSEKQIKKIIYFRKRGHSLPELRRFTGHSNTTILKYIKNVEISPKYQTILINKRKSSVARMLHQQKEAGEEAKRLIKNSVIRDKLLILTCLYWAEGEKRDFSLSNTDPNLIKTFVECLKILGISKKELRITIRTYEDLDQTTVIKFWTRLIGIAKKQIISINILKGKKHGKLKYGMCRIRIVKGGYTLKLIRHLIHLLSQEIVGI